MRAGCSAGSSYCWSLPAGSAVRFRIRRLGRLITGVLALPVATLGAQDSGIRRPDGGTSSARSISSSAVFLGVISVPGSPLQLIEAGVGTAAIQISALDPHPDRAGAVLSGPPRHHFRAIADAPGGLSAARLDRPRVNWHEPQTSRARPPRPPRTMKNFFVRFFTWWNGQTFGTQVWTSLYGEFVGEDEFGNRYYRTKGGKIDPVARLRAALGDLQRRRRSLEDPAGLARLDAPHRRRPADAEDYKPRPWQKPHRPNMTGTPAAHRPPARRWRKAAARRRPAITRPGVPGR